MYLACLSTGCFVAGTLIGMWNVFSSFSGNGEIDTLCSASVLWRQAVHAVLSFLLLPSTSNKMSSPLGSTTHHQSEMKMMMDGQPLRKSPILSTHWTRSSRLAVSQGKSRTCLSWLGFSLMAIVVIHVNPRDT